MLIVGHYKFWKRYSGNRRSFCPHCDAVTTHVRTSFFPVVHLYFIPLIPIFYGTAWHCSECTNEPSTTSVALMAVGLAVFLFVTVFLALLAIGDGDQEFYFASGGFGFATLLVAWFLRKAVLQRRKKVGAAAGLTDEFIAAGGRCTVCGEIAKIHPQLRCPNCNVRIFTKLDSRRVMLELGG